MTTRFRQAIAIAALCATVPMRLAAQAPATAPAAKPASVKPAAGASVASSPKPLAIESLIPMTCAQAWAAAGRKYPDFLAIAEKLATVSLANRSLDFPDTKEAGLDAGKGIAEDCKADPHGLLFGFVDKHGRRVAEAAAR